MLIRTRYTVGDLIHPVQRVYHYQKCPTCKHSKVGPGGAVWTVIDPIEVWAVNVVRNAEPLRSTTYYNKDGDSCDEQDAFPTVVEARLESEERNK